MVLEVIFSERAEENYLSVCEYIINNFSDGILKKFYLALDDAVARIKNNPLSFSLFDKKLKIRKVVIYANVTMFYKYSNERVFILAIFDNRQNPTNLNFT